MNRAASLLALGAISGALAHFAWLDLRRPQDGEDLASQLHWMQTRVRLDARQYERVKALHERLLPQLDALAAEVVRLRTELAEFEQVRRTRNEVDFVAYAKSLQEQQALDEACAESTRQLIAATADVMTPEQRERYRSLLSPVLPQPEAGTLR